MQTQHFLRQRKFYMILPVLVIPFTTLLFWALGGGQGDTVRAGTVKSSGLNVQLPEPHFDNHEIWDKLTLYEKAASDSAKFRQARNNDPYFDLVAFKTTHASEDKAGEAESSLIQNFPQKQKITTDPNEERVNQKLNELYREISKPDKQSSVVDEKQKDEKAFLPSGRPDPQFSEDVTRLEKLMEMMNKPETGADPEMQQIEGVLDKILEIQHPERAKEKIAGNASSNVMPVKRANDQNMISDLINPGEIAERKKAPEALDSVAAKPVSFAGLQNAFFGLEGEEVSVDRPSNAIEAVIHDTQELVAGATVKMRVVQDMDIKGIRIPKDELIYGTCSINGERLSVEINSVRVGSSILPVSLKTYDLDGLEGIYIPGAITRDAAKKASGDAMQGMQFMSLDPSLGAKAASAGIEAAKGLFSKKAKLIKVTVKAGYRVLLVDTNTRS